MKILFISDGTIDYLSCMIFHGLVELYNIENVIDYPILPHMYKNNVTPKHWVCGNMYSLYNLIDNSNINKEMEREKHRTNIIQNISNKIYDYIFYGDCRNNTQHLEHVCKYYNKNKIIMLDGQDHTNIDINLLDKGVYFKRELTDKISNYLQPISFSIPSEKILLENEPIIKIKNRSNLIPGNHSTYIYETEKEYYDEYKISWFATTISKSGFDCLRHLEICANGCIPDFVNIEKCPENTMTYYPKQLFTAIHENITKNKIDDEIKKNMKIILQYRSLILDFVQKNCTTKCSAKKIIEYCETLVQ